MNRRFRTGATLLVVTLAAPPAYAQAPTSEPSPAQPTTQPTTATPTTPDPEGRDFAGPEVAAPPSTHDALRAFEGGFEAGQALLERGAPLAAARTWVETAALLPESAEHRDNRAAVFNYVAEAYERALAGAAPRARLEEALAAFDAYVDGVHATYGADAEVVPRVIAVRAAFRARLAEMNRTTPPTAKQPLAPAPAPIIAKKLETRPWGGLAAGGGAALGIGVGGLAMMAVGAVRGEALDRRFDDPARNCDRNAPTGECGEIFAAGKAMNTQMIVGAVIGAAGVVAGTTLVALAAHRRRTRVSPSVGPGFAGLVLRGQF
jgi:hypothetical protein